MRLHLMSERRVCRSFVALPGATFLLPLRGAWRDALHGEWAKLGWAGAGCSYSGSAGSPSGTGLEGEEEEGEEEEGEEDEDEDEDEEEEEMRNPPNLSGGLSETGGWDHRKMVQAVRCLL
jgi:hypothetical protein